MTPAEHPKPLSLCLEDLEVSTFVQCVAVVGRQDGLGLDALGRAVWGTRGRCELWVSGDARLVLYRTPESPRVQVCRLGRVVDAPDAKPVILLDGDELVVGPAARRLRVHVHGPAPEAHPPRPLEPSRVRALAAKLAAAAALGASLAGCPIEIRPRPPDMAPPPRDASTEPADAAAQPPPPATDTATK